MIPHDLDDANADDDDDDDDGGNDDHDPHSAVRFNTLPTAPIYGGYTGFLLFF